MKTLALLTLYAVVLSWSSYVDSKSNQNRNSHESQRFLDELADKINKDLQDKPYLKLNQTVLDAVREKMYVAIVVGEKELEIVNVIDIKSKNKDADYSDSSESSESDEDLFK